MASSILHIKDSYYFEVPKFMWRSHRDDLGAFEDVWVRLDPDYQLWEAKRLYKDYSARNPSTDSEAVVLKKYEEWKHSDHRNAGKPFYRYLEEHAAVDWFKSKRLEDSFEASWTAAKTAADNITVYRDEYANDKVAKWSSSKIANYNHHLDGKIIIPQPFGELRNLYEARSGFCVSKFMIIEVGVAAILVVALSWLARRIVTGDSPQGRIWNLLEAFTMFIRDQVARPAIDSHDHGGDEGSEHAPAHHGDSGHHGDPDSKSDRHAAHGATSHGESKHGEHAHAHGGHVHDGDRFVPLLATIFFFVLLCNLMGMLPWVGAPTGSWGATLALAGVTFATVVYSGMKKFGFKGFFLNQIPGMDLPKAIAVVIKPMLFVIEMIGFLIKHLVLSIRLLANMIAGHVVLLGIMGVAFTVEAAASAWWPVSAPIAVVGSTALSVLELAVCFIQAYVFTFLSALFIGASVHKH